MGRSKQAVGAPEAVAGSSAVSDTVNPKHLVLGPTLQVL